MQQQASVAGWRLQRVDHVGLAGIGGINTTAYRSPSRHKMFERILDRRRIVGRAVALGAEREDVNDGRHAHHRVQPVGVGVEVVAPLFGVSVVGWLIQTEIWGGGVIGARSSHAAAAKWARSPNAGFTGVLIVEGALQRHGTPVVP